MSLPDLRVHVPDEYAYTELLLRKMRGARDDPKAMHELSTALEECQVRIMKRRRAGVMEFLRD